MTEVLADSAFVREPAVRPVEVVGSETGPPLVARRWQRAYRRRLVLSDVVAVMLAVTVGGFVRFGDVSERPALPTYVLGALAICVLWLLVLFAAGVYDVRHIGLGVQEVKRIARGAAVCVGLVASACYVTHTEIARGYVAIALPLAFVFTVTARWVVRRSVTLKRRGGEWSQRIVAVGSIDSVQGLIAATTRRPSAGLRVVGACVDELPTGSEMASGVQVLGNIDDIRDVSLRVGADVVAFGSPGLSPERMRTIAWQMEGTRCSLALAPGLTEVAGTRVSVSPIEGLPLMWVEQPQFTGFRRVLKRVVDVSVSAVLLVVLSPVFAATAILIKRSSRGPVLFWQSRLGSNGAPFDVCKFRTMVDGASAQRLALMNLNENDGGVLFKIKSDPRITSVGRHLRRLSIDELPQLWNVLRGEMSLVGPRPFATEDSDYDGHARRRLLVKPGMTGLWQVSGRSDLSWDDAVRLDLYYVENWSLALDLVIIAKTVQAVVKSSGAY